ncbi:ATP-binding protein [Agromyces sp. SYSU K20354]|uniref:ATP-binding protein n=1 Tax=Agromyces cavernae TaxID=2898659 RepID=UPI001E5EC127|nr:ATP-binding protein [Agromyces cavernae]MCD2442394.1 ATP-binding protein [Agromyces cavernae]
MSGRDGVATPAVAAIVSAVRGRRTPIVLIDGPSGAGKSTLADALVEAWPGTAPTLVRLDDVYPGWSGLDAAGEHLARTLVPPLLRGGVGRWRRWDWAAGRPGAVEMSRPGNALVIEGCGAFTAGRAASRAVRVWVEASDRVRRQRALDRDEGRFDPYWEMWDAQWRRHVRRTAPAPGVAVRLRTVGA